MLTALALIAPLAVGNGEPVSLKLVPSGAAARIGIFYPKTAPLSESTAAKVPDGLFAPRFGEIALRERRVAFLVDAPEGKPVRIVVDANANRDLRDDPDLKLEAQSQGASVRHKGLAMVELGKGQPVAVSITRPDPKEEAGSVSYHFDYGYEASFRLDGKLFSTFFAGDLEKGTVLQLDRNGDGKLSMQRETLVVGKPFNFTGTTYDFDLSGPQPILVRAKRSLTRVPMPLHLKIGQKSPAFRLTDMAGKRVNFPGDYKGKIVMMDCWATWCGWCLAEMPHVRAAYAKWRKRGFEVLSVCCDRPGMGEKVKAAIREHGMGWRHVYEGKDMETNTVSTLFDFDALPYTLLVDGDTGRVLGTGDIRPDGSCDLRGPGLAAFIGKALAEKRARSVR